MNGLSNYLASKLNDHVFGNAAYTAPSTIYVGLAKGAVAESDTGATFDEADYGAYARLAITNNSTNFPAAVDGVKKNATEYRFPTSTGTDNTIQELVFLDAATNGNIIGGGAVTVAKTIQTGDRPVYEIDAITITFA